MYPHGNEKRDMALLEARVSSITNRVWRDMPCRKKGSTIETRLCILVLVFEAVSRELEGTQTIGLDGELPILLNGIVC